MVKLPFTGAHTKRIYIVDTYLPIEEKIFRFHYALLTFHATNDAPRTTWPRYRRLGLRIDVRKKKKKKEKKKKVYGKASLEAVERVPGINIYIYTWVRHIRGSLSIFITYAQPALYISISRGRFENEP